MAEALEMACYSDVLCVWAYVAQVRLDELDEAWGDRLVLRYHYISLFGDTATRIGGAWAEKGGYPGFADHVQAVCADFPHVVVAPAVWRDCRPLSSATAHLVLKAAQLLEAHRVAAAGSSIQLAWQLRLAFFRDARDIGRLDVALDVAAERGLPRGALEEQIRSGAAIAALQADQALKERHQIAGSPSYLLNDGRQKLFGNVGYRILDANVREWLERPVTGASWC